jgi:hypothetical protein
MGVSASEIPIALGQEFIRNLARHIPDEEKRTEFQNSILFKMLKKGA